MQVYGASTHHQRESAQGQPRDEAVEHDHLSIRDKDDGQVFENRVNGNGKVLLHGIVSQL